MPGYVLLRMNILSLFIIIYFLVYGVCILDMLQTGFTTQSLWFYCVQNWGNIEVFSDSVFIWTGSILPIMAGLSIVSDMQRIDSNINPSIFLQLR